MSRMNPGPKAHKTVLPNGVRVITEQLDHVNSVSLGVTCLTGSRHDPPGLEGITHFLEHMFFKGTHRHSTRALAMAMDDIGGNVNGVTDRELLSLFARTSADHTDTALDLLFEMLTESTLSPGEVAREREVVLQEIAHVRDTPEEWMHEIVPPTVWPAHPLGRMLMGTAETVEQADSAALRAFLVEQVLAPDRLLVLAAGMLEHDHIVEIAARWTGGLAPGLPRPEAFAPTFHPGNAAVRDDGQQVHFCRVSPGIARADDRRDAFAVLDTILGGGSSSRLFHEIRDNRGLVYDIGSYLQAYHDGGIFVISAGTAPDKLTLVLELVEAELARLRAMPPSEEELRRAKVQIEVSFALAAESTGFRSQHLAASEIFWGRILSFDEILAGIERVTAEEVHSLAQQMFPPEQQALITIGPCGGE